MAGLGCFNERRWTTAGRSATAETRAGAASPRSPMPPNGRSSFTGTGGRPGARCLSSGTPRSVFTPRRSWTCRWTGSRARTCWGASRRSGHLSRPPPGRPGTGSRRSSAGASAGTIARTTRWTGRLWRCRGRTATRRGIIARFRTGRLRRRSRRPASPMSREAKSFRRIRGPTCWSAAPRFSRYGANTSSSETPSEKACLHTYSRRASSAARRAVGRCRPPPQRPQQNPVRIDGDGPPGRLRAMWR